MVRNVYNNEPERYANLTGNPIITRELNPFGTDVTGRIYYHDGIAIGTEQFFISDSKMSSIFHQKGDQENTFYVIEALANEFLDSNVDRLDVEEEERGNTFRRTIHPTKILGEKRTRVEEILDNLGLSAYHIPLELKNPTSS